jgi:uncharacterized protein (DUF952 family)
MGRMIYKVLTAEQWATAEAGGLIQGPVDVADGFIHLSAANQLQETLSKWFNGKVGCVLASFDEDDFGPDLKWEKSRGGDLFPHIYSELRAWQVKGLWLLEMDADGAPLAPDEVVCHARDQARPGVIS